MSNIPERFMREIQLHIARNVWCATNVNASLILGISGPPGEGKSFQCRKVLEHLGCGYIEMSTDDFGSALEAESAKYLYARYAEASERSKQDRKPYVILCDDIDVAIGQWGELTQYTVNRQYAIGNLMHLCDSPERINVDVQKMSDSARKTAGILQSHGQQSLVTRRIPIILTGNDFTKLYAPLLREGRMTIFNWVPSQAEKSMVVSSILKLSQNDADYLISDCNGRAQRNLPISFFSSLIGRLIDSTVMATVEQFGWQAALWRFTTGGIAAPTQYTMPQIVAVAQECIYAQGIQAQQGEAEDQEPQEIQAQQGETEDHEPQGISDEAGDGLQGLKNSQGIQSEFDLQDSAKAQGELDKIEPQEMQQLQGESCAKGPLGEAGQQRIQGSTAE